MSAFSRHFLVLALAGVAPLGGAASAEPLRVDGQHGNNTFTAVFDAPAGERITAVSSAVGCAFTLSGEVVSGRCAVPLETITVDSQPSKTDHFRQWATHKATPPARCELVTLFQNLSLSGPVARDAPARFSADLPLTVCGRSRADGRPEHVEGAATLVSESPRRVKIRARIAHFSRAAYQVGPQWTAGWLARVESLAPVVADEGVVELTLFAEAGT